MLASALAAALVCVAQDPPIFAAEHARCVRTERAVALYEAMARASDERLDIAAAEVLERRPAGLGVSSGLAFVDVARTTRELEGTAWTELQAFADSLDLSLTPGVFEARGTGPAATGEPLTVRVHGLWEADSAPDFTLTLTWISPEGQRLAARREPVEGRALARDGFEMYVHSPVSGPGTWLLEPCVERAGESACGVALPVDCVERFGERFGALVATSPARDDPAYPLVRALDRLVRYGARGGVALRPGELLAMLEGGAEPGQPYPHGRLPTPREETDRWVWALRPVGDIERAVCVLLSERETDDALFAGAVGERWSRFANETGSIVFATRLPQRRAEYGVQALFGDLAADTHTLGGPDATLTVVARAETSGRLQLALGELEHYPFDALVISSFIPSASAATVFPGLPRLLLSPFAEADEDAGLYVGPGHELSQFDELELPERTAAWLAR